MKLYRRIILLTLTLLLLVSATGMSVGLHLCGGQVRDLSFFGQAADCPMEQQQQALPPCHAPQEEQSPQKDCCEQHQLAFDRIGEAAGTQIPHLTHTPEFKMLAAVQTLFRHLWAPAAGPKPAYALYISPPIARDIPVLVQSFRL